jgi:uncharacterized membrane protein
MAFCAKCGSELGEGVAFCPKCGAQQGAAAPAAGAPASTGTIAGDASAKLGGLDANIAAALAYLWILGILWLILEPYNKNRFVRFHSFQAIALGVVGFVGSIVLTIIPILGWILLLFWPLVILVFFLLCIYKAYSKQAFKIPVIGNFAEKMAMS